MEIEHPTWNSADSIYIFRVIKNKPEIKSKTLYVKSSTDINLTINEFPQLTMMTSDIAENFIELSKKWFSTPLKKENFLKRLRHKFNMKNQNQKDINNWINFSFILDTIEINNKEIILNWLNSLETISEPLIPSDFIKESRPSSPDNANLRTIQITNTVDSNNLVAFEDLPFSEQLTYDDNSKSNEKRKIREARLRVALAKLKVERLAKNYFSRYGEDNNSDSSDLTSESEFEEDLNAYSQKI